MEEALWHKFNQHRDLKAELLNTGDAELVEVRLVRLFCFAAMLTTSPCRTRIRMLFGE